MNISRSLHNTGLPPGSTCAALGLFCGLHLGHVAVINKMLEQAGEHNLTPLVFTFDTSGGLPDSKRGMTTLLSGGMMGSLLAEMGIQELVCPVFDEFRSLEPEQFVSEILKEKLGAARVVCGFDFRFGKNAAGDLKMLRELCAAHGISVDVVPAVMVEGEPAASRRIRALVEEGDIPAANRILGRPFAIDFEVIHGRRLGRTLDWPTINQLIAPGFTQPRFGVYATRAWVNGEPYGSVTNVGVKPTVGASAVLAETYIQDFSGDLYGERVKVEFFKFLRPEQKFPDLAALKEAISADVRQAKEIAINIAIKL